MKIRLLFGVMALSALLVISSCGDDDPPPKAGITFEFAELELFESDGTITSFHPGWGAFLPGSPTTTGREVIIKVVADKPLTENAVIGISYGGTATVNSTTVRGDYEILGSTQNVIIEKGATSAEIKLKIFEDFSFEVDDDDNIFETVVITLSSVISGPAMLGDQAVFTLKIVEDDMVAFLDWDVGNDTRGEVDMDMMVNFNGNPLVLANGFWWGSYEAGFDLEGVNIPGGFPAGNYGLSFVYYSGEVDDLDIYSVLFSTGGTLNGLQRIYPTGTPLVTTAKYSTANINVWDIEDDPNHTGLPKIAQTMVKSSINYTNISTITVPSEGSRSKALTDFVKNYPDVVRKLRTSSEANILNFSGQMKP